MKPLLFFALTLPLFSCGAETKPAEASEAPTAPEAPATTAAIATPMEIPASDHNVKCGCGIDSIGKCGNYVEFDGEYAQIMNAKDMGLGAMEWCHQDGMHATVAGTRTGDEIVLSSIEVAE